MSREAYMRWSSMQEDEDDEENVPDECRINNSERRNDRKRSNEGGVRIVAPVGLNQLQLPPSNSTAASGRLICILTLVCTVCLALGGLVGFIAGVKKTSICRSVDYGSLKILSEMLRTNQTDADAADLSDFTLEKAELLQSYLTAESIRSHMRNLSGANHEEIKDLLLKKLQSFGFHTTTTTFQVMMSQPENDQHNLVKIKYINGHTKIINSFQDDKNDILPFAAFSPEAEVISKRVVYGHYGSSVNIENLMALNVNMTGAVLLIRQGKFPEAVKVRNAEQVGAVGVVFYPDPADEEPVGEEDGRVGQNTYPNGTGLPSDGILWSDVKFQPGDPTTPHLPSINNIYRMPLWNLTGLPTIPVQPISAAAARILLDALGGKPVPEYWKGGLDVIYRLGGSWLNETGAVELQIKVSNKIQPRNITNVHAWNQALDKTKVVHLGAHYDFWNYGISEPEIGVAVMLAIGDALAKSNVTTDRQVLLSFWDGKEIGLSGSFEFSELCSEWLEATALSYMNVDNILQGTEQFTAHSSPILYETIREAVQHVLGPEEVLTALKEIHLEKLKSRSDSISFTNYRGIPSVEFAVTGANQIDKYHLHHSQYDNITSVLKYLDPSLNWTTTLAHLISVTMLLQAERRIPPLHLTDVANDLSTGFRDFWKKHHPGLTKVDYTFSDILAAITDEIQKVNKTLGMDNTWYNIKTDHQGSYVHYRMKEERLNYFLQLSRRLLGPRGITNKLVTYSSFEEQQDGGSYFPYADRSILLAQLGKIPWDDVHRELSYILVSLKSFTSIGHAISVS